MVKKLTGEELVEKAEVISAVRGYENRKTQRMESKVDFTVSPSEADGKILMRIITETKSKSCYVGVDAVREMSEALKTRKYDKGILIGRRFTEAAKNEMKHENIEAFSEAITPNFKLEHLYLVISSYVEKLCRAKCDRVPVKESDCKGHVDCQYSCDVRLISDNSSFHFEHDWVGFLEKDLARLLAIERDSCKLSKKEI